MLRNQAESIFRSRVDRERNLFVDRDAYTERLVQFRLKPKDPHNYKTAPGRSGYYLSLYLATHTLLFSIIQNNQF
ncbi:hypothetical protein YC2023_101571 [Brassica napus]